MSTMKNESILVESKELREQMVDRLDILDKVKTLLLLPKLQMMTTQQVADYYEVDYDAIKKCYQRDKSEINSDGVEKFTPNTVIERLGQDVPSVKTQTYREFSLSKTVTLRVPNPGVVLFPKRAILRIGMLLRDSEVAKEVRTQLLNISEKVDSKTAVQDIESEQDIILDLAQAFAEHDPMKMMAASQALYNFQSRHIAALSQENEEVKKENEVVKKENAEVKEDYAAVTGEIVRWDNYACINKAIRSICGMASQPFGKVWNEFYDEMLYKNHISLKHRASGSYYKHIRQEELPTARDAVCAVALNYSLVPREVFRKAHLLRETVS